MQNSTLSSQKSGAVMQLLNQFLAYLNQNLLADTFSEGMVTAHFLRKAAHFTEYTVLGVLLCILLYALWKAAAREKLPLVLFIGLAIPLLDETIQLFIPGRSGEVRDVLLDFGGVLFGLAVASLVRMLLARKNKLR